MEDQALILQKRQYNTIIITGIAIAVFFYPVVEYLLITRGMIPIFIMVLSEVIKWSVVPLVYLYAKKIEDRDFILWEEKVRNLWFYIASIAVLFVLVYCASIVSYIPHLLGYHDDYSVMNYYRALLKKERVLLVFVCLTAGFTEEILLRGYILPRLYLFFKSEYLPVIISALIFSLLHIAYHNLSECIFTFLFGVICAVFYRKFQNIQCLIIFHFLYDLLIFLV